MIEASSKYPEGHFVNHWMAIGIVFGVAFGIPMGLTLGNFAFLSLGLPIGLAVGVAIGSAKEEEAKKDGNIRPLTEQEMSRKQLGIKAGIGFLLIGVIVLVVVFIVVQS